jgi:hypothetical protein
VAHCLIPTYTSQTQREKDPWFTRDSNPASLATGMLYHLYEFYTYFKRRGTFHQQTLLANRLLPTYTSQTQREKTNGLPEI